MSADGFSVVTLIFPSPHGNIINSNSFNQLNQTISFQYNLPSSVQTLSSNNAVAGNDLNGLLYLPLLNPGDSCQSILYNYVPENTTTQNNLPNNGQLAFLAVAPWINPTCTSQFLNAAKDDALRAFIFYLPNSDTTAPGPNDAAWNLGDGGAWKTSSKFPVYAIDGISGATIIQQMSLYSANLTQVPNGNVLASQFPPTYFVRLAGTLQIEEENSLPSLWIFLLIVLGILIFIIGFTSGSMHVIQRRRRVLLRRRVASGEVDLEQLGIKRLTVPRAVLDKMPIYTYPAVEKVEEDLGETQSANAEIRPTEQPSQTTATKNSTGGLVSALSQPTCAICLEDFLPGESRVRELPCRHIFHSECIDVFLRENSSLCPLCKKTSLPRGYCPPVITNAMVRRERTVRRMRIRVQRQQDAANYPLYHPRRWQATVAPIIAERRWPGIRRRSPQISGANTMQGMEMRQTTPEQCGPTIVNTTPQAVEEQQAATVDSVSQIVEVPSTSNPTPAVVLPLPEEVEEPPRSRWRRAMSVVWPGLV